MRILLINSLYAPYRVGGAEQSVQLLAESLHERGHGVEVVALHDQPEDARGEVNGIPVHYLALRNLYWPHGRRRPALLKPAWHALDIHNPWMAHALERVARAFGPDVVHTNNLGGFSSAAWLVGRRHASAVVHTVRDYHVICVRSNMFRDGANCERQCLRCAAVSRWRRTPSRAVDTVVGLSRVVLEQHLRAGYFAGAATAIIGNPVPPPPGASTAPRLGQPLRFGYIGRLVPEKGLELLADAFAPVRGAWSLLIAGRGEAEYETRLRQRLEPLGAEFRGWMQADDFYSTVDVVLVPSLWREPFGRSVVEAWQHGRPVIVASGGGPEEIVRPEVTGWIAPPDAAAWQTWLQALVDRPEMARDLADACRRESEAFTSEHIAAAYERVYEESRRHRDAGVTPR